MARLTTDPDGRSMATSGKGTGVVGYNVQAAVDAKHHLIVAHELTNLGHDRDRLSAMAGQAREATGHDARPIRSRACSPPSGTARSAPRARCRRTPPG